MTRGILAVIFGGAENYEEAAAFLRSVSPHLTDSALEKSVRRYAQLGFSPIKAQYREFLKTLEDTLGEPCALGCLHGTPSVAQACADLKARGAERLLWFMSSPFAASGFDNAFEEAVLKNAALFKEIVLIPRFSSFGFWHEAWLASVRAELGGGQVEASDHTVLSAQRAEGAQTKSDGLPAAGGQVAAGEQTLIFAAHSLPIGMAGADDYNLSFRSSAGWIARMLGMPWQVCFHSVPRSADPSLWLAPGVEDAVRLAAEQCSQCRAALFVPLSFIADNTEITADLDTAAASYCGRCGLQYKRARTIISSGSFIQGFAQAIAEMA